MRPVLHVHEVNLYSLQESSKAWCFRIKGQGFLAQLLSLFISWVTNSLNLSFLVCEIETPFALRIEEQLWKVPGT